MSSLFRCLVRQERGSNVTERENTTNPDVRKVCHWLITQICGWLLDWLLNTRLSMHNFNLRANYFVQYSAFGMKCNFSRYSTVSFSFSTYNLCMYKGQVYHDYSVRKKNSNYKNIKSLVIFFFFFISIFSQTCQTCLVKTRKHSIFLFVLT